MADVVTDAVESLRDVLQTITAVRNKNIHLYEQDQLLNFEAKLGLPAVGVLYIGLRGKSDTAKTGRASNLVCDILLLGGELCEDKTGNENLTVLGILDSIRKAVLLSTLERLGAHRKWEFIYELPVDFQEHIAYVQRWQTTVVLNTS